MQEYTAVLVFHLEARHFLNRNGCLLQSTMVLPGVSMINIKRADFAPFTSAPLWEMGRVSLSSVVRPLNVVRLEPKNKTLCGAPRYEFDGNYCRFTYV